MEAKLYIRVKFYGCITQGTAAVAGLVQSKGFCTKASLNHRPIIQRNL